METRLPPSVLPADPRQPKSSLLARYLGGLISSSQNGNLSHSAVEPAMSGALAIAYMHPFDPAERVELPVRSRSISLLEAVLELTNTYYSSFGRAKWPQTLEEFGPHLLGANSRDRTIDNEWVAAALVAAGCNPWEDHARDPKADPAALPRAVSLAIQLGMPGLLDRFLQCPGAWDAQRIADANYGSKPDSTSPVWSTLSDKQSLPCLEVLMEAGARPPPGHDLVGMLSSATPAAPALLARFCGRQVNAMSEKARAQVGVAWRDRHKKNDLSATEVEDMAKAAWGESSAQDLSSGGVAIAKRLSVGWRTTPNGSSSQAYDFMTNTGARELTTCIRVKAGPNAGNWSLLAAAAFSRIRQSNIDGAMGWSTSRMLEQQFDQASQTWSHADPSKPPHRNSLATAVGFDWRPGISINGVVAMALYGQRGTDLVSKTTPGSPDRMDSEVPSDLEGFAHAAGIDDLERWSQDSMPSAVEFTIHALKRFNIDSMGSLLSTWHTALMRAPWLTEGMTQDQSLKLLTTLSHFTDTVSLAGQRDQFAAVGGVLFPGLHQDSIKSGEAMEGHRLQAAILLALNAGVASKDARMEAVMKRADEFGLEEIQTVEQWLDCQDDVVKDKWRARLEEHKLEYGTAPAPRTSRSGPRL